MKAINSLVLLLLAFLISACSITDSPIHSGIWVAGEMGDVSSSPSQTTKYQKLMRESQISNRSYSDIKKLLIGSWLQEEKSRLTRNYSETQPSAGHWSR